ncbi:hypothetical protein SAMN04488100_10522 [Alkalibacterium putridalgicola]|uniref:Uncharacterized protein n=1 Tax=Alkalibacterium putridalgicola TaxID=426703 RepID=A0A1H7RK26_9LACT|nr:hypothetical protein [Alkalibacterium putridalgicola]GEK88881.1 hypothetical protein APU01nite_09200 [Alkalibacterium putridalgicola]SEL60591.1 hypothetical protein SAMN04488100_10522 [Alkalibacterium putridalgicola]
MSTYTLEGLADFILQLYDQQNEDQLWEIWLNKQIEDDFPAFKKKHYRKIKNNKMQKLSEEEEKQIIESNMRYIKPIKKGGET